MCVPVYSCSSTRMAAWRTENERVGGGEELVTAHARMPADLDHDFDWPL